MRGIDRNLVGVAEQLVVQRVIQEPRQRLGEVLSQQVGARRAADDQRAAGEDGRGGGPAGFGQGEAEVFGRVAGRLQNAQR